ncbi:MAG: sigma 54-interacting transcriptional regulator [Bacteroidota bacterium]
MNFRELIHIADLFDEAILLVGKRAEVVYANEAAAQLTGFSLAKLKTTYLFDLDKQLELITVVQQFGRKAIQRKWQRQWITANQQKITVCINSAVVEADAKSYLFFSIRPIDDAQPTTEKKSKSVNSLPVKGNLSKLAIEHLPVSVLWVRRDGIIAYGNRSACEALHCDLEEIIDKQFIVEMDTETTTRQWQTYWQQLNSNEKEIQFESYLLRDDQTILFAELTLTLLDGIDEQVMNVVIIDIGKRRLEEAQLRQSLIEAENLRQRLETIRKSVTQESSLKIITQNEQYLKLIDRTITVAQSDTSVLIFGETGTGKELLANLIHEKSERKNKPFVKINCAAISPQLLESELFGHEKGSFTNAHKRKLGRLEIADQGTIFLDEIGELPLEMQSKLLRVLQSGEFERVGGTETITIDIRLISATNRDLEEMIADKRFRSDLYYRIATFPIENMPLRARKDDIPLLAQFFLERYSRKVGKQIEAIHEVDLKRLQRYGFPGNIRELENLIERSVILTNDRFLNLHHWQLEENSAANKIRFKTFEEMQRDYILDALEQTAWKIAGEDGAAQLLNLHPKTLSSKMRKLDIKRST